MKRVFIVHGWGGTPEKEWLPWAAEALRTQGYEVYVPAMPNTEDPEIGAWVAKLAELVGAPDAETYFIGHSIGCQTILRYLETIDTLVGGAVFVAGWFNLEGLEGDEIEIGKPWIETPIDIAKVASVLPKSVLVISDDDPYGAFEENKQKFAELGSREVVLHAADHICEPQEPAILSAFQDVAG